MSSFPLYRRAGLILIAMWCRSERKRRHYTEAPAEDGKDKDKPATADKESDGKEEAGDNGTTSPGGEAAADGNTSGDDKDTKQNGASGEGWMVPVSQGAPDVIFGRRWKVESTGCEGRDGEPTIRGWEKHRNRLACVPMYAFADIVAGKPQLRATAMDRPGLFFSVESYASQDPPQRNSCAESMLMAVTLLEKHRSTPRSFIDLGVG